MQLSTSLHVLCLLVAQMPRPDHITALSSSARYPARRTRDRGGSDDGAPEGHSGPARADLRPPAGRQRASSAASPGRQNRLGPAAPRAGPPAASAHQTPADGEREARRRLAGHPCGPSPEVRPWWGAGAGGQPRRPRTGRRSPSWRWAAAGGLPIGQTGARTAYRSAGRRAMSQRDRPAAGGTATIGSKAARCCWPMGGPGWQRAPLLGQEPGAAACNSARKGPHLPNLNTPTKLGRS